MGSDQPSEFAYDAAPVKYHVDIASHIGEFKSISAKIKIGTTGNGMSRYCQTEFDDGYGSKPDSIKWSAEGLEVKFKSGQKAFIPKESFIDHR